MFGCKHFVAFSLASQRQEKSLVLFTQVRTDSAAPRGTSVVVVQGLTLISCYKVLFKMLVLLN